jgi:[ribosomal protein S18]-alanine N-acetyltransferase
VIETLTRSAIERHLPVLLEIDRQIGAEPWTAEAFACDLPEKFELSVAALDGDGRLVGFAVASRKGMDVHLHRLAVDEAARGRGIGELLVRRLAQSALDRGLGTMTLKVDGDNEGAIRFYRRLGFRRMEAGEDARGWRAPNRTLVAAGTNPA